MALTLRQLYRKLRYRQPIIVVSGLPRSGTSMTMRMLDAGGVPVVTDGVRAADQDNLNGYYELERVKDLARETDPAWLSEARGKAIKIISYLLQELPRHYNYRVLFMRRDLTEILASQRKMLEHRGETPSIGDAQLTQQYEDHLWRASSLLRRASHFETIDVHYRRVIEDPGTEARRIREFLGLDLDVESMATVVDDRLYRNRVSADS